MSESEEILRKKVQEAKLVVVKVGSKLLIDQNGFLDQLWMKSLVAELSTLVEQGKKVVLVSSGAISSGLELLKIEQRPSDLAKLQMAAAVGQAQLIAEYQRLFQEKNLMAAQVLMTHDDFGNQKRKQNARNTLSALIEESIIPIINENDVVSVDEIKFGDNDKLAVMLAGLIEAKALVLLTVVDGLLKDGQRVGCLGSVGDLEFSLVQDNKDKWSVGGMRSKLESAAAAVEQGMTTVIACGREDKVLSKIFAGDSVGTVIGQ